MLRVSGGWRVEGRGCRVLGLGGRGLSFAGSLTSTFALAGGVQGDGARPGPAAAPRSLWERGGRFGDICRLLVQVFSAKVCKSQFFS